MAAESQKPTEHRLLNEYVYDGMRLPGAMSAENLERIKDFRFQDDVMIVSYTKTGTAWIQEMVWVIFNDGDLEAAKKEDIQQRVPFLDMTDMLTGQSYIDKALEGRRPAVLKTHLPAKFYERHLREDKARYIIMTRNPKDSLVSQYYFYRSAKMMGNYEGSWDDFFQMSVDKELIYGSFFHIYESWLSLPKEEKDAMLWVRYEDMHKDLAGELRRIAAFLGKTLSDEKIEEIVAHGSFKAMKDNDATNYSVYTHGKAMKSPFMRAGKVGEWKTHFTEEQNRIYDEIYNSVFTTNGFELDFE